VVLLGILTQMTVSMKPSDKEEDQMVGLMSRQGKGLKDGQERVL